MDKKMTSGEIAKKAGVSQKAIRLYDEKGLLKPTDYSEGNYRLYDQAALDILEKIVALKQIGFSLEEIRDNLVAGQAQDIEQALRLQLKVMEEKRYRIDMVIDAINRTLVQKHESLDWDDVADIVKSVTLDQEADRRHWLMLQHCVPGQDWYVSIFRSMQFEKDQKVLDLGCGFSKLWRNNWTDIPQGLRIYGYDIPGSWAEDFEKFVQENESALPEGVKIDLTFEDLKKEAAWEKIESEKHYDHIIAHYVCSELEDPEDLVKRASKVLGKEGVFSVNGPHPGHTWDMLFQDAMEKGGVEAPFIKKQLAEDIAREEAFDAMVGKYFGKIERVILTSSFLYQDAEDLFEKMKDYYQGQEKFFMQKKDAVIKALKPLFESGKEKRIDIESTFLRCAIL